VAALLVWALGQAGLPVPVLSSLADLVLLGYGLALGVRVARFLVRRLLWRIRTKLIVSYLFIAVVPVVLLSVFFVLAFVFFSGLVASHMVSSEIERLGVVFQAIARTALARLPPDDAQAASVLAERLAAGKAIHPGLSHSLVRRGKTVSASGEAPGALPAWWTEPGFAGLVRTPQGEVLRAVWTEADRFLILDAPLDPELFADLQRRTGIHLLTVGGRVDKSPSGHGIHVEVEDAAARKLGKGGISGMPFFATAERTDWATGKRDIDPLTFEFQPQAFLRRLSPGALNTADLLVKALGAVGVVFLVVYSFALGLGLLLARSITRSVHALSVGTERLRQGDFAHPISVRSRDQLGELAESFNMMARGIQDLLRQQGEKERLEEELRIARQIQMSLLPAAAVTLPGLRIAALCLPAAEVGGDYYDLLPLSDTRMGVLIADVSGKGTSAALYMAELKGLVLSLARMYDSPAKLLSEANRILSANMDSRSFITMTYAVLDTAARTMRYARAGHNPIIHLEAASGTTRILAPRGLGLGIDRGERFDALLEEAERPLRSGDLFLLFTDGLSEAMNHQAELFGEGRLRRIVEDSEDLGSEEIKEKILEEIRAFVGGAAQHDDMTMVILKVA
jgi:serine phosphatase RsbU (regulator of sigma subunit)